MEVFIDMKCPICHQTFNDDLYEKKKICSNCGQKISLSPQSENMRIRNKLKQQQKNKETPRSDLQSKETVVHLSKKKKVLTKQPDKAKTPKTKVASMDQSESKKTIPQDIEDNSANTQNTELHNNIIYLDDDAKQDAQIHKEIPDNSNNNVSFSFKLKKAILQFSKEKIFKKIPILKKIESKRCEKYKEQLEVSGKEFFFNIDGFYDDTYAVEPASPDTISIHTILKIIGIILSIILGTVFLIYYMP